MTLTWLKRYAVTAVTLIAFVELLIYAHGTYVAPLYAYLGCPYIEIDAAEHIWLHTLILLSATFLPFEKNKVSSFMGWMLFVFCYVQSIVLSTIGGILPDDVLLGLQLSLSAGMIAILLIPRPRVVPFHPTSIYMTNFWAFVALLFLGFAGWVLVVNYGNMRLVGMADVYVQRFANNGSVGYSGYAMGILSGSVDPFLMAVGLFKRKPLIFIIGAAGQVIVYAVLAQKFVFLSLLYIPGFYFLLGGRKFYLNPRSAPLWRYPVLAICLLITGSVMWTMRSESGTALHDQIGELLLMRQFSLSGGLVGEYASYFTTHPLTYFTHISILKSAFGDSSARDVGLEIGSFLVNGRVGMNANANFFASDGLAALYLVGPAIMGFVVGLILRFYDKVVGQEQLAVAALTLAPFAFCLSESSLFTSLLTGGGILCLPILYLYREVAVGSTKNLVRLVN